MLYFYLVSVYGIDGFYEFLTMSREPLDDGMVKERCKAKHLFSENRDARDASVTNPSTEDIVRFSRYYEI